MTRYRIPFHMFFKWFVPYSRKGNFLMASLFIPGLGIIALLCVQNALTYLGFVILQIVWGTVTLNYHRRERLLYLVAVQVIGVGILTAFYFATKDSRPLYVFDSNTTSFSSQAED